MADQKEYLVETRDVYICSVYVKAESVEDAIEKAKTESTHSDSKEYSHTLDSSLWAVFDEAGNRLF